MTKTDIETAAHHAQWSACYELMGLSESGQQFDFSKFGRAMFHAGEAWAYYKARDALDSMSQKLDKKKTRS